MAENAAEREVPRQPEPPKEPIAKTKEQGDKAKKGINDFLEEKFQGKEGKVAKQEPSETEKQAPPSQYFEKVPQEPAMAEPIAVFCAEAEGKALPQLETDFLTKHYLLLKHKAKETGADPSFLSSLEQELTTRGIRVNRLNEEAEKRFKFVIGGQGGGQERRGEATAFPLEIVLPQEIEEKYPALAEEIKVANARRRAYGEWDFEDLKKTQENIIRFKEISEDERSLALKQVEEIMGKLREIRERETRRARFQRETGFYGERLINLEDKEAIDEEIDRITRDEKSELLHESFNRIFDRSEADPHSEFREAMGTAGEKEYKDFTNLLNQIRQDAEKESREAKDEEKRQFQRTKADKVVELIQRYSQEHKLREILHNAFYIADTGGDAQKFSGYTQQFASEFLDLAFLQAPEIEVAFRVREQVLYQIKRENGGFIPYDKVAFIAEKGWSDWEKRTRDMLRSLNEKGLIVEGKLDEWKIARALSISRGLGMVLLRFPEIIAECPLPVAPKSNPAMMSIPWETISWELNPLDHKIKRYSIGGEVRDILYAGMNRKKSWLSWNQDELQRSIDFDAINTMADFEGEERPIDLRNLSKIGSWTTHSGWRAWCAAMEGDYKGGLRKLLARNPGIAPKMLFNRYEIKDLTRAREQFLAEERKEHREKFKREISDEELSKAWGDEEKRVNDEEKRLKKLKGEGPIDSEWREQDLKDWEATIKRIPHVILRVITDRANRLLSPDESKRLMEEIFGDKVNDPKFQEYFSEIETALTLAKENLMKRRREKGEEFTEEKDRLMPEDFEKITDPERRDRAKRLLTLTLEKFNGDKDLQNKILKRIESRSFPFGITNEDIPFGEYRFVQTGGRGIITRRNNDWYQEVQANAEIVNLFNKFRTYTAPEQIVEQLNIIYQLAQVHDKDRAQDIVEHLARGLIRIHQKDGILKIPVFGEITMLFNALRHRGSSFAQTFIGAKAMVWDEDDIYNFTEQLRTILEYEKVDKLRNEMGGSIWHAIIKKTKVAFYLLLLFGSYELLEKFIKEK